MQPKRIMYNIFATISTARTLALMLSGKATTVLAFAPSMDEAPGDKVVLKSRPESAARGASQNINRQTRSTAKMSFTASPYCSCPYDTLHTWKGGRDRWADHWSAQRVVGRGRSDNDVHEHQHSWKHYYLRAVTPQRSLGTTILRVEAAGERWGASSRAVAAVAANLHEVFVSFQHHCFRCAGIRCGDRRGTVSVSSKADRWKGIMKEIGTRHRLFQL